MGILAINLTQHELTAEQKEDAYWVRFDSYNGTNSNIEIKKLLTFEFQPDTAEIQERAEKLAEIAEGIFLQLDPEEALPHKTLIGGAPYLMGPLEKELHKRGIQPMYSFSKRVSIETTNEKGIIKTSTFKHVGWIEV
jgi:hypothetical protein